MRFSYFFAGLAAFGLLASAANAFQESMAMLKDPHGSVELSCDEGGTTTLKAGEHFLVERVTNGWNVYLKSGCRGFIEKADLQLLPNEPLMKLNFDQEKKSWRKFQSLPDKELGSEAGSVFKDLGLNYFKILTAASSGDENAMALFYLACSGATDGAAAEDCFGRGWQLFHVIGDETFAKFVSGQGAKMRKQIAEILSSGDQDPISKPRPYIKRYFPKTYELLFSNER
jgi:hypothetical protein